MWTFSRTLILKTPLGTSEVDIDYSFQGKELIYTTVAASRGNGWVDFKHDKKCNFVTLSNTCCSEATLCGKNHSSDNR